MSLKYHTECMALNTNLKLQRNCLSAETRVRWVNWWQETNSRRTRRLKSPAPPMKLPIWFLLRRPSSKRNCATAFAAASIAEEASTKAAVIGADSATALEQVGFGV